MARVYLEPIEEEIDCDEDESVLDAAFRQGFQLAYGCREGQCSACKAFLLEGEVTLKRYSTFALSDSEEEAGYTLLCRAMPDSDLAVELPHVPEDYRLTHAIVDGKARVASAERVTRDIHHLVLEIAEPSEFDYTPGQYLDLHIPNTDLRRSFSMACLPNSGKVEFLIKEYSDGAFSSLLAGGALAPGTPIDFSGPYGSFNLTRSDRDVLMVAGGSGMAPVLALLRELADAGSDRKIRFFYGARTSDDLFYQDVMVELGERLTDFAYAEVLSEPGDDWSGPTGFVHEIAAQVFADGELSDPEVYTCGPPPMIDALIGKLTSAHGVEEGDIRYDKFTTSVSE